MFCGTKVDHWVGSRVGVSVALGARDGVKLGSGVFVSVGFKVGVDVGTAVLVAGKDVFVGDVVGVEVAVAHPVIPHITINKNSANLIFMVFSPFEISMIIWPNSTNYKASPNYYNFEAQWRKLSCPPKLRGTGGARAAQWGGAERSPSIARRTAPMGVGRRRCCASDKP